MAGIMYNHLADSSTRRCLLRIACKIVNNNMKLKYSVQSVQTNLQLELGPVIGLHNYAAACRSITGNFRLSEKLSTNSPNFKFLVKF